MLRPFWVVRNVRFSLKHCGFKWTTPCWGQRKWTIILKFLLGMSGHMVDSLDNMLGRRWIYRGLKRSYYQIDNNNILDIHKYLMKRTWYKIMFGWIEKNLMDYSVEYLMLLIIQNVFRLVIKNVWFNLLLLIYILTNTIKNFFTFDRCVGSCNNLNDISYKLLMVE